MIAEPYVSKAYPLTKRDTRLILASDGLWDIVFGGDRAFKLVKDVKDPAEAAKKLCSTAVKSRKCHDNVTVIVVNLRPEKKTNDSPKTDSPNPTSPPLSPTTTTTTTEKKSSKSTSSSSSKKPSSSRKEKDSKETLSSSRKESKDTKESK